MIWTLWYVAHYQQIVTDLSSHLYSNYVGQIYIMKNVEIKTKLLEILMHNAVLQVSFTWYAHSPRSWRIPDGDFSAVSAFARRCASRSLNLACASKTAFKTTMPACLCRTALYWLQPVCWTHPGHPVSLVHGHASINATALRMSTPNKSHTCAEIGTLSLIGTVRCSRTLLTWPDASLPWLDASYICCILARHSFLNTNVHGITGRDIEYSTAWTSGSTAGRRLL